MIYPLSELIEDIWFLYHPLKAQAIPSGHLKAHTAIEQTIHFFDVSRILLIMYSTFNLVGALEFQKQEKSIAVIEVMTPS